MYTLLVCADMYGEKINLEITFPAMPTISELQRKITDVFNSEAAVKRPQGYPNIEFAVARLQIYDDVLLKWADLVTCTQLHEYDQLYAFQPQSPWHIDVQKDLPPPRPPTVQQQAGGYGSSPIPPSAGAALQQQQQQYASGSNNYGSPAPPAQYASVNYSAQSPFGGGARTAPAGSRANRSPTQDRLEQQRQREEQLRQELQRVHDETQRMEQLAQQELEDERRRAGDERERLMRQKEAEIARQREALRLAEEELMRARAAEEGPTARNLYR